MFLKKRSFKNRTIGELHNHKSYTPFSWTTGSIKLLIILSCIFLVFFVGKYLLQGAQIISTYIGKWALHVVSSTIGEDMIKDEFGNINVMIVWYGGDDHAWSYLADSIMVASFNPKLWAVTMISVPRDLYVHNKNTNTIGRINALFARSVARHQWVETWAQVLSDKLEDITGLTIPYYALIDFDGFEQVIDTLGGIIVDVPYTLHDRAYPNEHWGYMTIHIDSGVNLMDGDTALKYARSRHSTSDFSRSLRQQIIIQWVVEKLKKEGLWNIKKAQQLYENYVDMVSTNITLKEMIGIAKDVMNIHHMFSFGYTIECSHAAYRLSSPWCLLYTPQRELFGGAAVLLPFGATANQISMYEQTQFFAFLVAHNQEYLIENQNIHILNGIDTAYARQKLRRSEGFATQLAVKLKKYAFTINNVQNFSETMSWTIVYVLGTGDYQYTVRTLRQFVDIDEVITTPNYSLRELYPEADILLILGNSYIDQLVVRPFSYYR